MNDWQGYDGRLYHLASQTADCRLPTPVKGKDKDKSKSKVTTVKDAAKAAKTAAKRDKLNVQVSTSTAFPGKEPCKYWNINIIDDGSPDVPCLSHALPMRHN